LNYQNSDAYNDKVHLDVCVHRLMKINLYENYTVSLVNL